MNKGITIEYTNNELEAIYHTEGRITPKAIDGNGAISDWQYEYTIKDHLGNGRVWWTWNENTNQPEVLQQADYYPFGMMHAVPTATQIGLVNQYQYNGKELNTDFSLDWSDYGARFYDAQIGKWTTIDPLAESYYFQSGYNYVNNNPLIFNDPSGMFGEYFAENGNKLGEDENGNDGKKYIVSDKNEANQIKQNDKKGNVTEQSSVNSAELLPSDIALTESLDVLNRTESKTDKDSQGGLHGESSKVMKDGTIIRGESGKSAYIDTDNTLTADESLPANPNGTSNTDVEATIHSHVTGTISQNGQIYSHDALQPSNVDIGTFGNFESNIIVGPLGQATGVNNGGTISINQPKNGVAIYKGSSSVPSIVLGVKAVQKILNN